MLEGSGIPLVVIPRLRERSCGDLERRSIAEVKEDPDYRDRLGSWSARPPNGESLLDTALRAVGWLATVDDGTTHTLVVAHGALIGAVLAGLEGTSRADMRWRPENCEAIRREVPTGAWGRVLDELRREAAEVDLGN